MTKLWKALAMAAALGAMAAMPARAQDYDDEAAPPPQGYAQDYGQGGYPPPPAGAPDYARDYYGQGYGAPPDCDPDQYGPDDAMPPECAAGGGYCDAYGCPDDYYDMPLWYGPVFYDDTWYTGPFYYRDWYGGRQYWLHGGWHYDAWRGPRPSWWDARRYHTGPALGRQFYQSRGFQGQADRNWSGNGARGYRAYAPGRQQNWQNRAPQSGFTGGGRYNRAFGFNGEGRGIGRNPAMLNGNRGAPQVQSAPRNYGGGRSFGGGGWHGGGGGNPGGNGGGHGGGGRH